jgi:hypothetical protein
LREEIRSSPGAEAEAEALQLEIQYTMVELEGLAINITGKTQPEQEQELMEWAF